MLRSFVFCIGFLFGTALVFAQEAPLPEAPDFSEQPELPDIFDTPETPAEDEILQPEETPSEDEILQPEETPMDEEILQSEETPAEVEVLQSEETPAEVEVLQPEETPAEVEVLQPEETPEPEKNTNSSVLSLFEPPRATETPSAPVGADGERATPQRSASRELLLSLVRVPSSTVANVEKLPLDQYLSRLQYASDGAQFRRAVQAYWHTAVCRGAYSYWDKRVNVLTQLAPNVKESERSLLKLSLESAKSARDGALVEIRASVVEVGQLGGLGRDVWPETLPHAGAYRTNYSASADRADLAYLHRIITLRNEQLSAATAAYRSAELVLQETIRQGAPLVSILQALDALDVRRTVFFDVLMDYNDEILDYVLRVSTRRGADLAPLLTLSAVKVPTENYVIPPAPTPVVKTPPAASVSIEAGTGETLPAPTLEPSSTESPYDSEEPLDAPVLSGGTESIPLLDQTPGSDFTPIGGETGSDSTLPPIAPLPLPPKKQKKVETQKVPLELVDPPLDESDSVLIRVPDESVLTSTPAEISMRDILARVSHEYRESAANAYWSYAIVQAQLTVLAHQKDLLNLLSAHLLEDENPSSDMAFYGIVLEKAVFELKAEFLGLKIVELKELRELSRYTNQTFSVEQENFLPPTAVTRPKTEGFALRLEHLAPGSPDHNSALQLAGYLEFCVSKLPGLTRRVLTFTDFMISTDTSMEPRITALSYAEYPQFIQSLFESRQLSTQYFRLIYTIDSTFTTCIFLGSGSALSLDDICARFEN